jgi:hypothetical protein
MDRSLNLSLKTDTDSPLLIPSGLAQWKKDAKRTLPGFLEALVPYEKAPHFLRLLAKNRPEDGRDQEDHANGCRYQEQMPIGLRLRRGLGRRRTTNEGRYFLR